MGKNPSEGGCSAANFHLWRPGPGGFGKGHAGSFGSARIGCLISTGGSIDLRASRWKYGRSS